MKNNTNHSYPTKPFLVKNFYSSKLFWKAVLIVFVALYIVSPLRAKTAINVCQGNIFLSSQAEVNAFSCSRVTGNLIIQGRDIVDLSPLNVLVEVEGNCFINENPLLTSLKGLENLGFASTLVIFGNLMLSDISSIANLNLSFDIDVLEEGLIISANPLLSQCCVVEQISTRGQKSIGQNARGCNSLEEVSFACDTNNRVTGFMLVNAETDEDIGLLNNRDVLSFDSLGNVPLSIRVLTGSDAVGTVSVGLDGPVDTFRIEKKIPYTLLGDGEDGEYTGMIFPPGFYFLSATPYADDVASGPVGEPLLITFSVSAPEAQIVGFSLINASTHADIRELTQGSIIDLDALGDTLVNIRANTSPTQIGSVVFELDGPVEHMQTENIFPYALFGNLPQQLSLYKGQELVPGIYTLSARPFESVRAQGEEGLAQVIQFEVVKSSSEESVSLQVFPNPSDGEFTIYNGGKEAAQIDIYDTLGEKIIQQKISQSSYLNATLSQGLYIIQQTTQGRVQRKKIIIK